MTDPDIHKLVSLIENTIFQRTGLNEYDDIMPRVSRLMYHWYCSGPNEGLVKPILEPDWGPSLLNDVIGDVRKMDEAFAFPPMKIIWNVTDEEKEAVYNKASPDNLQRVPCVKCSAVMYTDGITKICNDCREIEKFNRENG